MRDDCVAAVLDLLKDVTLLDRTLEMLRHLLQGEEPASWAN
jgi:hypothetical protein